MQPVVVTYQGAQCGEFTKTMESSPSRLAVSDDSERQPSVRIGNQKKISVKKEGGSNGKRKAKAGKPFESKRMKLNNDMIARLLQLRFKEGEVKRRLVSADTKTKISLAWQNLASILSQDLEKAISREQAYPKYRKLKSMYRKEKRDSKKPENDWSMQVLDEQLWVILNDVFAKKDRISGDVLADTIVDKHNRGAKA
ncbi:hypothetical protein PHMEG_00015787 [Phytophthora megakarya]|uniref:Uncharacterized protein n=1 Tax=Phytophthora megakarya TaxID=4795 RepID=A0A225W0I4_9STRA|nr:hypothetical protein PHMEG_00015787 [Phytophthora megakarya]